MGSATIARLCGLIAASCGGFALLCFQPEADHPTLGWTVPALRQATSSTVSSMQTQPEHDSARQQKARLSTNHCPPKGYRIRSRQRSQLSHLAFSSQYGGTHVGLQALPRSHHFPALGLPGSAHTSGVPTSWTQPASRLPACSGLHALTGTSEKVE